MSTVNGHNVLGIDDGDVDDAQEKKAAIGWYAIWNREAPGFIVPGAPEYLRYWEPKLNVLCRCGHGVHEFIQTVGPTEAEYRCVACRTVHRIVLKDCTK